MHSSALPSAPDADATGPSGQEEAAARILVVDDTFDNRSVLRRRLVKRGFEVVEAEDGSQALDIIAGQPAFDLILLDVMMPGLSGLEVLTRIRADFTSQQLPVIMVTAKSFSEDVVEALQLGADDYVTKPVDFNIALARINAQIMRKKAADEMLRKSQENSAKLVVAEQLVTMEAAEKQRSAETAAYLATHDPLTGLANRTFFCEALQAATSGDGQTFSVLFIDLDRFKAVNDAMGHLVGDQLLKQVAQRITALSPDGDRLARFGGDEFILLHRHPVGSQSPVDLGERIVEALEKPFHLEGHDLVVGASIGVATHLDATAPTDSMVGDADLAMYAAKKGGGNRVRVFDNELAEQTRRRTDLELELQLALKRGEFKIVYQPIINLGSGSISGFEALLRWEHPQRGTISPAEFIPIAEETALIVSIGEWVLREACKAAMTWPGPIKIAVNLSTVQFERSNLVSTVVSALANSGLPAQRLELEITESLILAQSDQNLTAIRQLRELGVRIAMDDFGTGYSSLSYLRDFEFDKIKLDQSFVRSLAYDEGSRAIVSSISSLATNLGITTTAEGVETTEQLDFIRANGMTEVQGYLLGRPIAGSAVSATVTEINDQAESAAARKAGG